MNRIRFVVQILAAICLVLTLVISVSKAEAVPGEITVNTTELLFTNNGNCDFREALAAAADNVARDACPAGSAAYPDPIVFNIGGGGTQEIAPTFTLDVNSPVLIEGGTQPGFSGVPLIKFSTASTTPILRFNAGAAQSSVRDLQLGTSTGLGALIYISASNMTVMGSYIGTDGASVLGPDSDGIVLDGSSNTVIGGTGAGQRNLFGGEHGVTIEGGANNTVQGNYFGLTSAGNALLAGTPAYPMHGVGLGHTSNTSGNTVRQNVISGSYDTGVYIERHASFTTVAGNIIGLGADGATQLGNTRGVSIEGASDNIIGGDVAADRNVISGNMYNVIVRDYEVGGSVIAAGNGIRGNYIGITADGVNRVTALGVEDIDEIGVYLTGGDQTTIGGGNPADGNVIAGNDEGIHVLADATGTEILNNKIGTNAGGTAALLQERGIELHGASAMIGDNVTPGDNLISGNEYGILLNGAAAATIYGNKLGVEQGGYSAIPNEIGISIGNTSTATIAQNWIANSAHDGLAVSVTDSIGDGSSENCFTDNTDYGAHAFFPATFTITGNWWGSPTGPAHWSNPAGTGDAVSNGVAYSPFLTTPPAACRLHEVRADFDGNATSDLAIYRPSNGVWYIKDQFNSGWGGLAGDVPVPGDYNGDGSADVAIYRPSTGVFYVKNVYNQGWGGQVGDVPAPGDYNGDGKTDVGIWRPSTGVFYVKYVFNSGWGTVGDIPVPGDYDGDGTTEVAVFHPSNNVWYIKGVGNFAWGNSGDVPVPGDYNGDGTTDIAVWRPSTGTWYVRGQPPYPVWGSSTDIPVPGDYDGNGTTDLAVYIPSSGTWSVKGQFNTVWGAASDYPVEAPDTNGDGDPYQ